MKKLIKVIIAEVIIAIFSLLIIYFKSTTDNIFFPKVGTLILIWIFLAIFVGIGIWYKQIDF